jgi:hypothetical protein
VSPALRAQLRAAALSASRVFAAAAIAAWLATGQSVSELDVADLHLVLDAGAGAVLVTAGNALRRGETRFGRGATPPAA